MMDKAGLGRRIAEAERIARKASGFLLSHEERGEAKCAAEVVFWSDSEYKKR